MEMEKRMLYQTEGTERYERWAKVFNIKQLSQAVIWLKEHGDMDYGELQARAAETTDNDW